MDLSERRADVANRRPHRHPQRHPWEQARARFFHALAHELAGELAGELADPTRGLRWLDVGAGDAWLGVQLADELPPGSTMTCWDVNYSADDLEQLTATSPGIRFTAERPDMHADVISLLDVLEHVDDDVGLLRTIVHDNLTDDGVVIVSVPAYQGLFTAHDTALAHYRRYSPDQCRALLRAGGLRVDAEGGLFSTLLVPRAAQAGLERARSTHAVDRRTGAGGVGGGVGGVGGWSGGPLLTRAITTVLTADIAASRWVSGHGRLLPGLSYWAVARRRR